jgi:hypothetical protein
LHRVAVFVAVAVEQHADVLVVRAVEGQRPGAADHRRDHVLAGFGAAGGGDVIEHRQRDREQNHEDRHHDEQLDQREAATEELEGGGSHKFTSAVLGRVGLVGE